MTRPTLILAALIALASPALAVESAASGPVATIMMHGDEVQGIRTCRPGERPANPRQCRAAGGSRPLI